MNIQPPAVLLMGASGSGKTSALTTFIPKGIETFVLVTEPGGAESLVDNDDWRCPRHVSADRWWQLRGQNHDESRHGAAGGAVGFAPWRRLTIWTEGDAHIRAGGGGTSLVFVNETAVEAFRGVWFKVSPQGRTGTDRSPGAFRWNLGAHVLPRAHVDVGIDFYLDKIEGSDEAFKTFLAQLHMYL